jgi:hypothetical protein
VVRKKRAKIKKKFCSDAALHGLVAHRLNEVGLDERVEVRDLGVLAFQQLDMLNEL